MDKSLTVILVEIISRNNLIVPSDRQTVFKSYMSITGHMCARARASYSITLLYAYTVQNNGFSK